MSRVAQASRPGAPPVWRKTTRTCPGTPVLDTNGTQLDATRVSATVSYTLALWPVSDPLFRYHYAKRVDRADLIEGHDAYFASEDDMASASIQRVLDEGEASVMPPTSDTSSLARP